MKQLAATIMCLGCLVLFGVNHWLNLSFEYAEWLLLGAALAFFNAID